MDRRSVRTLSRLLDVCLPAELSYIVIAYYGPKFCGECLLLTVECRSTKCGCGKHISCRQYRCDRCEPCTDCHIPLRYLVTSNRKKEGGRCIRCIKLAEGIKPSDLYNVSHRFRCGVYSDNRHCVTVVAKLHDKCVLHK